jgi:protein-S-isoprenylcysteine O-methyltransferase Ste14
VTPIIAKVIWGIGCVAFYLIRYPHLRRARKTPVAQSRVLMREKLLMTIAFIGMFLVPLVYVLSGQPEFAAYAFHPMQAWLGTLVLIGAMALLYRTHRDLGRVWSITLEIRNQHTLVTRGIYETLRHPMYSAHWLWVISQALLLPNWIAGFSGLVGFGVLFFGRVGREERMMLETFGDEYRAYMARTHRLIPGIY